MDDLLNKPCPCGSGSSFERCCHPCLADTAPATTAEALMRSRYTAHVVGDAAYLARSWHPATRPAQLSLEPRQRWLGLVIKRVEAGEIGDGTGIVEYVARFKIDGRGHRLHEVSRFERHQGLWVYVDGELVDRTKPRGRR